jgi:hypothetical protein
MSVSTLWALDLKEGQYQITSNMEMSGMPASMPTVTFKQCMSQQNLVPIDPNNSQDCKITDMKTKGNKVTWTMQCTQQGSTLTANGSMTFHGDWFEGITKMKMGPEAGNMIITNRMKGKYIGACEK